MPVELQALDQLENFKKTVVLPVFERVQKQLDPLGYRVQIAETLRTGDEPLDELLTGLVRTFDSTFLSNVNQALGKLNNANVSIIIAALMVQLPKGVMVTKHFYEDRFCVGIECITRGNEEISARIGVFHANRDGIFKRFVHGFAERDLGRAIAKITDADLLQRVIDIFAAFHDQAVDSPKQTKVLSQLEERSHQLTISDTPPEEPAKSLPSPETIAEETEASKQKAVQNLLESLGVEDTFEAMNYSGEDLDRLMDWTHAIQQSAIGLPEDEDAYKILLQQATGFAKPLTVNPTSALVFADYFELYCALLKRDDLLNGTEVHLDDEAAFVARVMAAGEPDAPEQINAAMGKELRSVLRRLSFGFGKLDDFGHSDRLGICNINACEISMEDMIRSIQGCSEALEVRFERLSRAILQVYLNVGELPINERRANRPIVDSFWRSARKTIQEPTETVRCIRENKKYFEFEFARQIEDQGELRMARARVTVTRPYGRTVLQSYMFEML